ncbi:hypothetical protein J7K92_01350 [bacterium]|nr:hypothetical protein [bacterium]
MELVPDGKILQIVLKIAREEAAADLPVSAVTDIVIQAVKILTIVPKIVAEGIHVFVVMDTVIHLAKIPITALKIAEVRPHLVIMSVPTQAKLKKDALAAMSKKEPVEIMTQIPVLSGLLGETIKIAGKMSGLITTDVREIGSKEKRFSKDVQITNVIRILNG